MTTLLKRAGLLIVMALLPLQGALASSTGSVSSGAVKPGLSTVEWRNGYTTRADGGTEDERYRSRVHLGYGFNDRFGLNIISSVDKRKDQSTQYDATTVEFDTNVLKQDQYGVTAGIRLAYALKDGDKKPDTGEIRLMLSRKEGSWDLRFNQLFIRQIGEDSESGLSTETRWRAYKSVSEGIKVGIEGFHNFGMLNDNLSYSEQSHTVGPLVKFDVGGNAFIETGYRTGISDAAPDNLFKVNIGYNF